MTDESARGTPTTRASGLVALGGSLLALGSLLDWWTLETKDLSVTNKGLDVTVGVGILQIGVILTTLAVAIWIQSKRGRARGWAIAALVVAGFGVFGAFGCAFTPEGVYADYGGAEIVAETFDVSEEDARESIPRNIRGGFAEVKAEPGTYVAFAGSLLGALGAYMAVNASGASVKS